MDRTRDTRTERRHDRGETLVEVVMTMIIIGITVTALLTALASTTNSATSHRYVVVADSAVRNAAEVVKLAVTNCQDGATVPTSFSWPTGFTHTVAFDGVTALNSNLGSDTATLTCPAVDSTSLVAITVTGPTGTKDKVSLRVRTP